MSRRIARPYAQALFAVAKPQGGEALREVNEALQRAAAAFTLLPQLVRAFEVPTLSTKKKAALLEEVVRTLALPPLVARLLFVLQSHYRLRFLPAVAEAFAQACDAFFGVMRGKVEVPGPLEAEKRAALERVLAQLVGSQVVLEHEERPELLAGFVVRLGSLVFDGSLKRQLERFAETSVPLGGRHASQVG
jgi:F-type H+-transporting ATPase subunit delta